MNPGALSGIAVGKPHCHWHAQDRTGRMSLRKTLTRRQLLPPLGNFPAYTVVMEACAGAHWIARQVARRGHPAKLSSPHFVTPFRQGTKTDCAEAQAIWEVASRPRLRLIRARTEAQQTGSARPRVREARVRDRASRIQPGQGLLLAFGISRPKGPALLKRLPTVLAPPPARPPRVTPLLERLPAHFH